MAERTASMTDDDIKLFYKDLSKAIMEMYHANDCNAKTAILISHMDDNIKGIGRFICHDPIEYWAKYVWDFYQQKLCELENKSFVENFYKYDFTEVYGELWETTESVHINNYQYLFYTIDTQIFRIYDTQYLRILLNEKFVAEKYNRKNYLVYIRNINPQQIFQQAIDKSDNTIEFQKNYFVSLISKIPPLFDAQQYLGKCQND